MVMHLVPNHYINLKYNNVVSALNEIKTILAMPSYVAFFYFVFGHFQIKQ